MPRRHFVLIKKAKSKITVPVRPMSSTEGDQVVKMSCRTLLHLHTRARMCGALFDLLYPPPPQLRPISLPPPPLQKEESWPQAYDTMAH